MGLVRLDDTACLVVDAERVSLHFRGRHLDVAGIHDFLPQLLECEALDCDVGFFATDVDVLHDLVHEQVFNARDRPALHAHRDAFPVVARLAGRRQAPLYLHKPRQGAGARSAPNKFRALFRRS